MKGDFDYGIPGKVVEKSPQHDAFWADHASYPFQSHDLWFITEDIAGASSSRTTTPRRSIAQGQSRRSLARGGQGSRRRRRPTFRPRRRAARRPSSTARSSIRKIRAPISRASDQARRGLMPARDTRCGRSSAAASEHRHGDDAAMNMPAVNPQPARRDRAARSRKVVASAERQRNARSATRLRSGARSRRAWSRR